MKARVLIDGKFCDQVVDVIRRDSKGNYRLATVWDEIPYPAWFGPDEIEVIEEETSEPEKGENKDE